MKKILLSCALTGLVGFAANAQAIFELEHEEMSQNTNGVDPSLNKDEHSITFYNHVKNTSSSPLTDLKWKILQADFPFGWSLWTLCDNNICYIQTELNGIIANDMTMDFNSFDPDSMALLKPQVWVPNNGDNGIGILKVRVFNASHSDTAVYLINKNSTNISKIQLDDSRVSIFPNPGTDKSTVNVFVNKDLKAKEIVILNVLGAKVASQLINGEVNTIPSTQLASGNYLIQIVGEKGQVMTTRKWVK